MMNTCDKTIRVSVFHASSLVETKIRCKRIAVKNEFSLFGICCKRVHVSCYMYKTSVREKYLMGRIKRKLNNKR